MVGAMTLLSALDAHAAARPRALAVDDISYHELRIASLRVAAGLRSLGVAAGDRVAIYAENSHGFVHAYLGALRAGAIAVPVNVLYRSGDLDHVLADSDARVVCVSAASAPFVTGRDRTLVTMADVMAWAGGSIEPLADAAAPAGSDIALLIYTSGTTGRSKGAMLSHDNLAAIAGQVVSAWGWTEADTLLLALPLFHMHGLGAGLDGTLVAGGRLLLRERFDASDVVDTLAAGQVTMFFGVPTMYVRLVETAAAGARFDAVRLFVSGSAALPAAVHHEFAARFGAAILERYGATEFGFALSNPLAGPRHAGHVGWPLPGVTIRVIDGHGAAVGDGTIGELLVAGPGVFVGYWRNPDATDAAIVHDGDGRRWYRSGDLGSRDPDRGYRITGRLKELIITGGFNVYPSEVEHELLQLAGVRAAAVVGAPHPARGEVPVAFVEIDAGFDEGQALAALRERLASFKVPRSIHVVAEMPRNAMGKIEKARLRERLAS
jgi:malonyl-CoA/methylmalonyl-CoA synthetase